jgi:Flp pilus assembly protein TadD
MAEETEDRMSGAPGAGSADPAATAVALGGASRAEADAFLRKQGALSDKQNRLLDLEIEELAREDKLRHWSLVVRHISDVMKVTFELAVVAVSLVVITGIGAALWSAAHDNSLVIEAFSVPPDLAARGLNGQTVAAQLQDRLAAMQDATDTARPANSYTNNWGDDIKVAIPDTGVSVGEAYRFLADWLGHRTHITGEVWRNGDTIAITARAGSDGGATVTGKEADFPALLQKAAEAVYRHTQPYRFAVYVEQKENNYALARTVLQPLAEEGNAVRERAWAELGLGSCELYAANLPGALAYQRAAVALAPDLALGWDTLKWYEGALEHEENSVQAARIAVRLMSRADGADLTERARKLTLVLDQGDAESGIGDFDAALADYITASRLPEYSGEAEDAGENATLALGALHDARGARAAWRELPATKDADTLDGRTALLVGLDAVLADWPATLSLRPAAEAALQRGQFRHQAAQLVWPYIAIAMAQTGEIASAKALVGRTPPDCDLCLRTRGKIAALDHDWPAAAYWYALAARDTPSIPFADTDWGAMLQAKGDYDGAIAKFREANLKSPHFADPLERWGEALIRQNRSDRALAKFAEADKYAPNWGRLHLKWGEALLWSGKPDDAQKQFGIAAGLDLSPSEKSELARMRGTHG